MTTDDWTSLLDNPKAILGPYQGKAPPLATFAPYAWRTQFDHVSIAGHFLRLPETIPPSWGAPETARAEVVIEFVEATLLRVEGFLEVGADDDTLHGAPRGAAGECNLIELPEPFLTMPDGRIVQRLKRFSFAQPGCSLLVEAWNVRIIVGRRAGPWGHGYAA